MELKTFFAQNVDGNVIPGAIVYVYYPGTTDLATGLEDEDGNPLDNPFQADSDGQIKVAAPNGKYDIRVSSSGRDHRIGVQFFDASEGGTLPVDSATGTESLQDALNQRLISKDTLAELHALPAETLRIGQPGRVTSDGANNGDYVFDGNEWRLADSICIPYPLSVQTLQASINQAALTGRSVDGGRGVVESQEALFLASLAKISGASIKNTMDESEPDFFKKIGLIPGTAHPYTWNLLTYHGIDDANAGEQQATMEIPGEESNYTIGDLVVIRGGGYYEENGHRKYLYQMLTEVIAVGSGSVTLRDAFDEAVTDLQMANITTETLTAPEGVPFFIARNTKVRDIRVEAAVTIARGGVYRGEFVDIECSGGRQLMVINSLSFVSIRNLSGSAKERFLELANNCHDSTFNGGNWSYVPGGQSAHQLLSFHENTRNCHVIHVTINCGPFNETTSVVKFGAGRRNSFSHSTIYAYQASTHLLLFQDQNVSGGTGATPLCQDNGVKHVDFYGGSLNRFFRMQQSNGNIIKPFIVGCNFYGAVTVDAGEVDGTDGRIIDNVFESGALNLLAGITGFVVTGNHIPGGLSGLTDDILRNNTIHGNTSDASLAVSGVNFHQVGRQGINVTTPSNPLAVANYPAGSLKPGDVIRAHASGNASGTGNSKRFQFRFQGQGFGSITMPAGYEGPWSATCEIVVESDTAISLSVTTTTDTVVPDAQHISGLASLNTNAAPLRLEGWVDDAADTLFVNRSHGIATKTGFTTAYDHLV
ncbi:hypothetical protein [Halomonas stenophila]|uniref:Uncharacterized protein n=1 Tax=Halomonas stenophila TaxID=795312 RepID=A0A7W5HK89_9GAMM|nr:hypothetical protein [Halomonas stenophila]MBB3229738.1 hypothetical protein [Halomonas stenophila]